MIDPYDVASDPMFSKFFKNLLTQEEIMKSDDIPCDNEHLEKLESAKRACHDDIEMVLDGIYQQMDEKDLVSLFTNPLEFGESMQQKVLDYIESVAEGKENANI